MSEELNGSRLVEAIPILRVYALVLAKSSAQADDLVQDTLERAWRGRANFQPGSNLKAWLFGILRNRFIDEFRKHRGVVEDVDGQNASKLVSPPSQHWRAQYSDLVAAINALAPEIRDALVLVIGAGMSHEEAAAVLGCPLGTVKSRIRRARTQLLEIVEIDPGSQSELRTR